MSTELPIPQPKSDGVHRAGPGLKSEKVITCIIPKDRGLKLVEHLAREKGITEIDMNFARGVGRMTPLKHRGVGETSERAVVSFAVPEAQADALFDHVMDVAGIDHPHGGLIFMHGLLASTGAVLPDYPEEP